LIRPETVIFFDCMSETGLLLNILPKLLSFEVTVDLVINM